MPMNTSTQGGLSQRTNVYAEREMLKHAAPVIVLDKTGPLIKPMPKNKGVNIKFRRPIPFEAATVPLQEGVTPTGSAFRYEDVSGALDQYGDVAIITDVIEDTHEDPVLNDLVKQLGENIARTKEALNYAELCGGTNVFYANGTARTDVNTVISLSKLRAVARALKAQKAMKVTQVLDGSPNYMTRSVEASYIAVCHTDVESDIRNLPSFTAVADYGQRRTISEYELGSCEEFRFLTSPDLAPFEDGGGAVAGLTIKSTAGTSADVYPVLCFGKEAWGMVPLRGQGSVEPTIIPVGQKDKSDPLGQRGYAGWKLWHLALILNELWMARLEVAVTDL